MINQHPTSIEPNSQNSGTRLTTGLKARTVSHNLQIQLCWRWLSSYKQPVTSGSVLLGSSYSAVSSETFLVERFEALDLVRS